LIIGAGRLFVFMEPTSPRGRDLRERGWYASIAACRTSSGPGASFFITGQGTLIDASAARAAAVEAAVNQPEERFILFELGIDEARCNGYGDVSLPDPGHWVTS